MQQTRLGFFTASSLCLLLCCVTVRAQWVLDKPHVQIVKKFLIDCLEVDLHTCFAEKLSNAIDNGMDWSIPIFDGVLLKRNGHRVSNDTGRALEGIHRLHNRLMSFLEAHTVTVDFTSVWRRSQNEDMETERRGGGGGGGGGGGIKKIGKKERKMVQYALFVLLGIFGLTVPMMLKTLGLIAGKALISAKVALIMLGSIALKKIFQADHHGSGVKVHTHTIPIQEDEHDRFDYAGPYKYTAYVKPSNNLI